MVSPRKVVLLLLLITLVGGYFRFYNLNWDAGQQFHPDERNIAMAVLEVSFPYQFNPKFYAYGTVPIYTIRLISQQLSSFTGNPDWTNNVEHITLIGRILSCVSSILTIPAIFLLALTIVSPAYSLLAAFTLATTPIHIQYAHFSVTESAITLYGMLIAYLSVRWYISRRYRTLLLCGVLLGISIATKISTTTYVIFPCIALMASRLRNKHILLPIVYLFVSTICVYVSVSSVTFIYLRETLESLSYERSVAVGKLLVFYTYQFIHTRPLLFHVTQLPFTMGYPLTVLSLVGLLFQLYWCIRKPNVTRYILFLWMILYVAMIGSWFTKFVRYMIPAYPFLILSGVYAITEISKSFKQRKVIYSIIFIGMIVQASYAYAFLSVYTNPQTRHQALRWIYAQTPLNATFLTDDASEFLPETSDEESMDYTGRYVKQIPHFGLESIEELAALSQNLARSDYYVIGTRRQLGVVQNHPNEFPKTSHFYNALFDGSLGYTQVAQFSSYPTLSVGTFSWSFPDDSAEETVQVFDHPTIYIFQNTHHLDEASIFDIIQL